MWAGGIAWTHDDGDVSQTQGGEPLTHLRGWLKADRPAAEAVERQRLKVTRRYMDDIETEHKVEMVTFVLAKGATKSDPVDLIPDFTRSGAEDHSEMVFVELLPMEMRSPEAKNDGHYDMSKHDLTIYPLTGNVKLEDAQKCLENALTLFFEDCADDDKIIARNITHFDLKAGNGIPLQIQGVTWNPLEKPPGAPSPVPGGADLIQSVSNNDGSLRGGLYRYRLNGTTVEGQAWFPLAGPDISTYWQSEITYFKTVWVLHTAQNSTTRRRFWLRGL